MSKYMHQQRLSALEDQVKLPLSHFKHNPNRPNPVLCNTRLVIDDPDNPKIIQERRASQIKQLKRQVKMNLYLHQLMDEKKRQDKLNHLLSQDIDVVKRN